MRERDRNAVAAPVLDQLTSRTVRLLRQRPGWVVVGDDDTREFSSADATLIVPFVEEPSNLSRGDVSDRLIQ